MAGNLREILPRWEIRKKDEKPGRYPTIARTGDSSRRGNNNVFFDDTQTIIFTVTSSFVSYPTTLPLGSQFLLSDISSNIQITASAIASVTKRGVENWINLSPQIEPFTPFSENKLFELNFDNADPYILTGSQTSNVGLGFSSGLKSKTMIRLTLPVGSSTTLNKLTASLYYYNQSTARFEQVGELEPPIGKGALIANNNNVSSQLESCDFFQDAKMFGALGNNVISGSDMTAALPSLTSKAVVSGAVGVAQQIVSPNNATQNVLYSATGSQLLDMSKYITSPFLLEKMVVELPIMTGRGWGLDKTRFRYFEFNSAGGPLIHMLDAGGPAVTIGLLNQFTPNKRDIIITGSFIPSADNAIFTSTTTIGENLYRYVNGFPYYATPAGVVNTDKNGVFTGSVVLNMIAAVSNGVVTNNFHPNPYNSLQLGDSYVAAINPFGRSMSTLPSGRSYFGKEYTTFQNILSTPNQNATLFGQYQSLTSSDVAVYNMDQGTPSPYLIMPTDKLILFASKHRPVATASNANDELHGYALTGSHDIAFNTGTIFVTLYGSLISAGQETYDLQNQRLETLEIHEGINVTPPPDRFDIEYQALFSGSYLSAQLSGSLFTLNSNKSITINNNRVVWVDTAVSTSYGEFLDYNEIPRAADPDTTSYANYDDYHVKKGEKIHFSRLGQHTTDGERWFDSMMPSISDIFHVDNAYLYGVQYFFNVCSTPSPVGAPIVTLDFDTLPYPTDAAAEFNLSTNVDWTKSFPYEPKYSAIKRVQDASQINVEVVYGFYCGASLITLGGNYQFKAPKINANFTRVYQMGGNSPNYNSVNNNNIRSDTVIKLIYGIGDLNTYPNQRVLDDITNNCFGPTAPSDLIKYGSTQSPKPRALLQNSNIIGSGSFTTKSTCPHGNVYRGIEIRGWKYGISNAFPQFSKSYFRFNRYGQPRDMLEQRPDTKFQETVGYNPDGTLGGALGQKTGPVQVKFVNSLGEQVKPEATYSSNLSVEVTSSLPYFDGVARNREDPLNLPALGLSVVT